MVIRNRVRSTAIEARDSFFEQKRTPILVSLKLNFIFSDLVALLVRRP